MCVLAVPSIRRDPVRSSILGTWRPADRNLTVLDKTPRLLPPLYAQRCRTFDHWTTEGFRDGEKVAPGFCRDAFATPWPSQRGDNTRGDPLLANGRRGRFGT
jgi:hypothetical protein